VLDLTSVAHIDRADIHPYSFNYLSKACSATPNLFSEGSISFDIAPATAGSEDRRVIALEKCVTSISRQVTLARATVACRCHVCAFLTHSGQEHELLLPFVAEALSSGDRVLQIIDRHDRPERMRLMIESGINADAFEQEGRLRMMAWEDAYLRGARFDLHAMLQLANQIGAMSAQTGMVTRAWADMSWAASDFPGTGDVIEYESRLNTILPNYDMAVVCAYEVAKFSSTTILNVLHAHPHVIIGGILAQNPFYVPPDEFLPELKSRKPGFRDAH
jgi:hypothetical protein